MAGAADPVLLAFDTSTEVLALAVSAPAGRFTLVAAGGASASAMLLPQAMRLLAQAGVDLHALQAVAFGCGPGAFTGLRTACAVAQGLGLGLGVPLLPIDSLLIVAEDARQQLLQQAAVGAAPESPLDVAVLMDARIQEVYAACYRYGSPAHDGDGDIHARRSLNQHRHLGPAESPRHALRWQVLQAPALYTLPAMVQALGSWPAQAVAGSALEAFAGQIHLPVAAQPVATETNRAAALLQLALQAWTEGQAVDAAHALPLYLRDKVAQTTAERLALRPADSAAARGAPVSTVALQAPVAP